MKPFIITGLVIIILLSGISTASAQQQSVVIPVDFIIISPKNVIAPEVSIEAVPMPWIKIPDNEKNLTWWPDTDIDYKMPNILSPESTEPVWKSAGI